MELKLYKLKNISNKRAHGVDFQVGGGGELMWTHKWEQTRGLPMLDENLNE